MLPGGASLLPDLISTSRGGAAAADDDDDDSVFILFVERETSTLLCFFNSR